MLPTFDVIVAGLGAMGSAATFHLARSGQRVLGLDQFQPPHRFGSSHGESRIIREAYFEHPLYVPLVQRAYELWRELELETGRSLLRRTGGLMIGTPESDVVSGALRSAREHALEHDVLTAEEIRRRFPALQPGDSMVGVWEPRAGILTPEACVEAHLQQARLRGAELRFHEPVLSWTAERDHVVVTTGQGRFTARRLVLSAGAWAAALVPSLPLQIERQVMFWFEPDRCAETLSPERCPVHIWQHDGGQLFYGFPNLGSGVKVAHHHHGERTWPDHVRREVGVEEITAMRSVLTRFIPSAAGRLARAEVCFYTNTPDEHFLIDTLPDQPSVLIVSPCSGHGFKFSSVIGEVVAELICGDSSRFDLSLFGHHHRHHGGILPSGGDLQPSR